MKSIIKLRGWGTILNFLTVLVGALIGIALKPWIAGSLLETVRLGLGIITIGISIKMFLGTKQLLIVLSCFVFGGLIGAMIGLEDQINLLAKLVQSALEASGGATGSKKDFVYGLVVSSVLFCVGPMTLLGCIQDGIQGDSKLLQVKSVMDGIVAVFFAAAFGTGLVVTAFVVLILQGLITLLATRLKRLAEDEPLMVEWSAVGGALLMVTGIGLAEIKEVSSANFLPALALLPIAMLIYRKVVNRGNPALPSA